MATTSYNGTALILEETAAGPFVLTRLWTLDGAPVHQERFPIPAEFETRGPNGIPLMSTTRGVIERSRLEETREVLDNDNETAVVFTWRLDGEIVRRSPHVVLKKVTVEAAGAAAAFGS